MKSIRYNKEQIREIHDEEIIHKELDRAWSDVRNYCYKEVGLTNAYDDITLEELESYRNYLWAKSAFFIFGLEHVKTVAAIEENFKRSGRKHRKYEPEWLEYLTNEHGITEVDLKPFIQRAADRLGQKTSQVDPLDEHARFIRKIGRKFSR